MQRRWNINLWAGFAIVLLSVVSYVPLFTLFPVTRDVPWANYLLFLAGALLLFIGMKRAFGDPQHYRGKISGSILSVLSLLMIGVFCFGTLYASKQIPNSPNAPRLGQPAPAFTLASADGKQIALADLIQGNRGALLIFYRGYW
ncbi:MAG TPA: hypothetical protein VEU96_31720 [Bryobacteraceae bacterium]|nr:hypothetical protein [Bryobacteraceae bacterium]